MTLFRGEEKYGGSSQDENLTVSLHPSLLFSLLFVPLTPHSHHLYICVYVDITCVYQDARGNYPVNGVSRLLPLLPSQNNQKTATMKSSLDLDSFKAEAGEAKAGEVENYETDADRHARLTRRLLFKVDTRVLPVLALLFLCSFLDRTNVGNAKIIGLASDVGMSNLQYNQGLAVFYATYIVRCVRLTT